MRRTCGRLRKMKQRLRARFTVEREDRQLCGVEPTLPAGAVRDERVPAAPDPPQLRLIRQALREGWPTPDANKPKIVDELLAAFHDKDTKDTERIRLARLLLLLDRTQFDIDHRGR